MAEEKRKRGRPVGSKNRKPKDGAAPKAQATPKAPRKATRRPSEGHTTEAKTHWLDLSDDQQHSLMCQHSRSINEAEGRLELAKKAVKSARDLARGEIGKDALHRIKLYNDLQTEAGQARLREQMDMTMQVARWSGMPTKQGDLFEDSDPTPIEDRYHADGKRAGLAGEAGSPPTNLTGPHQQAWMRGYTDGQAVLAKGFKPLDDKPKGDSAKQPDEPVNWHALGAKAFVEKRNDTVPADVPAEHHEAWLTGFNAAKAASEKREKVTDYAAQGRLHRRNGGGGAIPDAVPTDQRDIWLGGWREEDAAMLADAEARKSAAG